MTLNHPTVPVLPAELEVPLEQEETEMVRIFLFFNFIYSI